MQKMAVHEVTAERSEQNPEISGVEYQQGELQGIVICVLDTPVTKLRNTCLRNLDGNVFTVEKTMCQLKLNILYPNPEMVATVLAI